MDVCFCWSPKEVMRRPRNAGFYKSDGASLRVPRRRFTAPARLQSNWGAVAYAVGLVYSAVVAILAPIFRKLPAAVGWAERRQLGCRELMGQRKLSFGGLTCITWGPLARNSHVCAERKLRLPEPDRIRLSGRQSRWRRLWRWTVTFSTKKGIPRFNRRDWCQPGICT